MRHAVPLRLSILVGACALALAGCGRRGPLELPPGAPPTPQASAIDPTAQTSPLQSTDQPGLIQPPNQTYQEPAANKLAAEEHNPKPAINAPPAAKSHSFFLDPLL